MCLLFPSAVQRLKNLPCLPPMEKNTVRNIDTNKKSPSLAMLPVVAAAPLCLKHFPLRAWGWGRFRGAVDTFLGGVQQAGHCIGATVGATVRDTV